MRCGSALVRDGWSVATLADANLLSFAISSHYQKVPVYHELLRQDGVRLPSASDAEAALAEAEADATEAAPRTASS